MFGRNKKIDTIDTIDTNVILILKRLKKYDKVNFETCIRENSIDIMHLNVKVDNLNDNVNEILKIIKSEDTLSKSIIAEAEERMQKLSNKIDELETDKRKLVAALGGAKSGNNKLRKKNRAIELDKKKLLKELKAYETKAKSKLDSSEDNGGYISKKLPPVKPKPQKTRLKNRVKNYQAKNILKEITEEKEQKQDV